MNSKQLFSIKLVLFCTIIHASEQAIITPEYLLQNTTLCAQNNNSSFKSFMRQYIQLTQEKPTPLDIYKKATDIAKDMMKQNPLCFVGECMAESCYLTRSKYPHARAFFEEQTSSLLKKQIEAYPDTTIKYTSFASGGALPELIATTKVLIKKANARLAICLIDLQYELLVEIKKESDEPSKIKPQTIDSLHTQYEELLKDITHLFYPDLLGLLCKGIQHQQFINWLTEQFPHAQIALHIYESVDQYLEHNAESPAHVVTAIDSTPNDFQSDPLPYYQHLCLKTLQLNPISKNISLQSIDWRDSNAILSHYYLNNENNPQAKLISFCCEEQEEEQIYEIQEQLTMDHS